MRWTIPLLVVLGCTGDKELPCPDGMVRNFEGDCVLPGGDDSDTDPDTDTGDTDTGDTVVYDICPTDAAHATIQAGIDAASSGDTLTICPETFNEAVVLDKPLILVGNPEGATTRIDARGDGVVLSVTSAASGAVLSDLVLRNGDAGPSDSSGGYGGGLRIDGATITARGIQVEDGIASYGGGGIALLDSDSTLEDITVLRGRSGDVGGGVYVSGGTPVIHRLTVQGSYASRGAGLYATQTPLQVRAAVFFQNDVQEQTSGILVEEGQGASFSNVVVALGTGGDDSCAVDTTDGASLYSAAAFNNAGIGLCTDSSSGYNLSYANTVSDFMVGGVDGPGDHDLNTDPFFVGAPHGDFQLRDNSPCIDAGRPDSADNDRDGSRADIGAFGGPYSFQ